MNADVPYALARVKLLIQDGSVVVGRAGEETKELRLPDARLDRFMDGPATRRLAVVDFDPATGEPVPTGVRFEPFGPSTPTRGAYLFEGDGGSPGMIAMNAFGTVFNTVKMFEKPGALGRQVRWAFGRDQLLIVPRAGNWANAFYDRQTGSLQFYWFDSTVGNARIYTALSRDIVAHECGHALLDAVVPSLYDSLTPQSIAIHEAIADLVAVLMALESRELRQQVLEEGNLSISGVNWLNKIAEQFGMARPSADAGRSALRELGTDVTLAAVRDHEPHEVSTVLSSLFYDTLESIFEAQKKRLNEAAGSAGRNAPAAANRALGAAQGIFAQLLLRSIDYLPPGDLTFADIGRSTIAADVAADRGAPTPAAKRGRKLLVRRFRDRGIIKRLSELDCPVPDSLSVPAGEVPELHRSDWAAYRWVEAHRETLGIPADTPFTVLPRVDATKRIGPSKPELLTQRELIIKVAWSVVEKNKVAAIGAAQRRVPTGATIALHWETGRALALVRSDVTTPSHRRARDEILRTLVDEELLVTEERVHDGAAVLRVVGDVAEISGTQQLLHLAGDALGARSGQQGEVR